MSPGAGFGTIFGPGTQIWDPEFGIPNFMIPNLPRPWPWPWPRPWPQVNRVALSTFFFFFWKLGLRGPKETQNGTNITFFDQFCPRAPMFVLGTQNQKDAGRKTMQNPASRIPNGAIWCKLWPKTILGKPGSIQDRLMQKATCSEGVHPPRGSQNWTLK